MDNLKVKFPKYFKDFKCIGGECEDSCCVGWDIDIDKKSFYSYKEIKDEKIKEYIEENIFLNENKKSDFIDYGKVKLKEGKRCAFLNCDNLCNMYIQIGEKYLSNVCTSFPRILNKIDGKYEISLDVSCPEASRLVLLNENGIDFSFENLEFEKKIISSELNTFDEKFENSPFKYFKEIREKCIEIVKDRDFKINERMYILGEFLYALEYKNYEDFNSLENLIKEYNIKTIYDDYSLRDISFVDNVEFFKDLIEGLDVFNQIDNERFIEFSKKIYNGYKFNLDGEDFGLSLEEYIDAYKIYEKEFGDKYNYIFENYLVNFIYNNMFPFSESDYMFDGYMMLLIRYSYIKFCLVGIYLENGNETKENIISLISSFEKAVGHHKTYMIDIFNYVREEELDNIDFVKMLLPKY